MIDYKLPAGKKMYIWILIGWYHGRRSGLLKEVKFDWVAIKAQNGMC
jgi:hypothetical protein